MLQQSKKNISLGTKWWTLWHRLISDPIPPKGTIGPSTRGIAGKAVQLQAWPAETSPANIIAAISEVSCNSTFEAASLAGECRPLYKNCRI